MTFRVHQADNINIRLELGENVFGWALAPFLYGSMYVFSFLLHSHGLRGWHGMGARKQGQTLGGSMNQALMSFHFYA